MSKGFVLAEEGHIVTLFRAQGSVAAVASSACFNMSKWGHATLIFGVGAGSTAVALTLHAGPANAGTSTTALEYRYANVTAIDGDVLNAALAWAGTTGAATQAQRGVYMVIEIDSDELPDGKPWLHMQTGAAAGPIAGYAILSGGRFQEDNTATVLS